MFNFTIEFVIMKYKIDKDSKYTNFSGNNLINITSTIQFSKICQWRNGKGFYFSCV